MSPDQAVTGDTCGPEAERAHFVFIPLMAQGHIIPAIDTALLLSTRGAVCSITATPATAARVRPSIDAARQSGLEVRLVEFPLEYVADGADNLDNIAPERNLGYFSAVALLSAPIEDYLRTHSPPVTCIVSDFCHPWTIKLAASLGVPRLTLFVMCAFSALCEHNIHKLNPYEGVPDCNQPVVVPGLEKRIELTRVQSPCFFRQTFWGTRGKDIDQAQAEADGIIINTFLELEPDYIRGFEAAWQKKVWSVGPVSLHHQLAGGKKVTRGDANTVDDEECLRWLDGKEPGSVVYVSFGTIAKMEPEQILELGHGLELSGYPFIWVLNKSDQFGEPLQELQKRVASCGLMIQGWVPQVLILSHAAVGCFLTHAGWNSLLEAITAGMPVVTWPRMSGSDHYVGEKLAVEDLGIGLSIAPKQPDAENKETLVRREVIQEAVTSILGGGDEGDERRTRARALGEKARAAMEVGGSSHANLCDLVNRFTV